MLQKNQKNKNYELHKYAAQEGKLHWHYLLKKTEIFV